MARVGGRNRLLRQHRVCHVYMLGTSLLLKLRWRATVVTRCSLHPTRLILLLDLEIDY